MHRCRQLLAGGLLLVAALLAAPVRAVPAAHPAQAAYPHSGSFAAPGALTPRAYLPLVKKSPIYDLAISRVEVIQGVTLGDSSTTHIAGRPALLRVFVSLSGGTSLAGVTARVRRFAGGVQQGTLNAGPLTVNAVIQEGNLGHTF